LNWRGSGIFLEDSDAIGWAVAEPQQFSCSFAGTNLLTFDRRPSRYSLMTGAGISLSNHFTQAAGQALCGILSSSIQVENRLMKFATDRPYSDPEKAARKLIEIANSVEAVQDGRIYIERINGPFLYEHKGSPVEYKAGLDLAIDRGWLWLHESGTYVKFTQNGAELFA
jgi:hypothetical protein